MKTRHFVAALALALPLAWARPAAAANYETVAIRAAVDAGCIKPNEQRFCSVTLDIVSICFVGDAFIRVADVWITEPTTTPTGKPTHRTELPSVGRLAAEVLIGCDDKAFEVTCY